MKEGAIRPSNRTYYFIDYRQAIDGIKWRTYKLGKDMQVPTIPANERKEWVCSRCGADYTQLEVLAFEVSSLGFVCERCKAVLSHEIDRTSAGHEKVTRLNNQLKFITDLLLRIDAVPVPDNSFEIAIQSALPVTRDEQHQVARATVVEPLKPTSVKGLADTGPKKIDVKIHTSEGPTEEEKEAERLRKEKIAQQNALPAWMANSTVSGESFLAPSGDAIAKVEPEKKFESDNKGLDDKEAKELSNYLADLKREQEMEAARKKAAEEEEDDDDEDDDEFEDVVPTPPVAKPAPSPLRQSSVPIKSEPGVNGNSNGTDSKTPPLKREMSDDEDRQVKKVKVEETAPADDDDDDEDEGLEFEDV